MYRTTITCQFLIYARGSSSNQLLLFRTDQNNHGWRQNTHTVDTRTNPAAKRLLLSGIESNRAIHRRANRTTNPTLKLFRKLGGCVGDAKQSPLVYYFIPVPMSGCLAREPLRSQGGRRSADVHGHQPPYSSLPLEDRRRDNIRTYGCTISGGFHAQPACSRASIFRRQRGR